MIHLSLSTAAMLSPDQRAKLAADPDLGGGNVLSSALAAHPQPDVPFIRAVRPLIDTDGRPRHEFSVRQLDRLAQSWSAWYVEQGVRPRDRVAIQLPDSFAYSVHSYALSQIGAIPVLINSHAPRAVAAELCRQTDPVGLYFGREQLRRLGDEIKTLSGLRWAQTAEDLPAPPAATLSDRFRFRHAGEDPVSILHSSGTTGRPKPVVQTHDSSVAGPRYRLRNFTEPVSPLMMTAQPQSHLGAVVYTTYAILAGTPLAPLYDPTGAELAAAAAEHRPRTVMAFGHAYAELAALDLPAGALDSVDGWISMGDAVHDRHIKQILAQRSADLPVATFYDRFGTTELGWGIIVQPRTLSTERSDRRIGKPDPIAQAAVLRTDGTEADVGEIGLFGAQGGTITAGYWNDADTTYRSKLGGYWLTGDLAYRDADGNYFQVDRAVDAIETAAGTGYSVLMEEVILNDVPGVLDCAVVAGRHEGAPVPVAVVTSGVAGAGPATLFADANAALRRAGHPQLALLEMARSEADFPVGVTGKVLKRQLRDKYADLDAYLCQGAGKSLHAALANDDRTGDSDE
jgi:acyl-coenzyme A synthetase/AMP-(fatty) acid ligase